MDVLSYLLIPFQQPMLILLTAVGTFAGVYVGAIPGLSATMAVSLLVSFTYGWGTYESPVSYTHLTLPTNSYV